MEHTAFAIGDEQRADLVPIHLRGEDGAWAPTEIDWARNPDWWAGGHGLYSTPRDYLRFQRCCSTAARSTACRSSSTRRSTRRSRNQIGSLDFPERIKTADPGSSADFVAGPGYKFGLGLLLNVHDVAGRPQGRQRRVGGPVQHPLLGRPRRRA